MFSPNSIFLFVFSFNSAKQTIRLQLWLTMQPHVYVFTSRFSKPRSRVIATATLLEFFVPRSQPSAHFSFSWYGSTNRPSETVLVCFQIMVSIILDMDNTMERLINDIFAPVLSIYCKGTKLVNIKNCLFERRYQCLVW